MLQYLIQSKSGCLKSLSYVLRISYEYIICYEVNFNHLTDLCSLCSTGYVSIS